MQLAPYSWSVAVILTSMTKQYKQIFFDLDHTLWDFETNSHETLHDLYIEMKLDEKATKDFEHFHQTYHHHNAIYWERFRKGYINRDLNCFSNDTDYITFTPLNDKSIIVKSNLSCVDEGSMLEITLKNGEKIEIKSWNNFNCDGVSYFNWFSPKDIDKLKSSEITTLFFYSDGEASMVDVPKNQKDYFIQLLELY